MTNEQYLVVSYFTVGLLCFALAVTTYLWLRRSFTGMAQAVSSGHFAGILRKLFPLGIILPALLGFVSVGFYSCEVDTYKEVVAERAYLIAKNQQQLSACLSHMVIALMVWGLIAAVVLLIIKRQGTNQQPTPESSGQRGSATGP